MRARALLLAALMAPALAPESALAADPPASCVVVRRTDRAAGAANLGSGTVVACEGGWSLVLTNSHVCPKAGEYAEIALGWKRYRAWVCYAPGEPDLAALLVRAELPASAPSGAEPEPGCVVYQWGYGLQLPALKTGKLTADTAKTAGTRFLTRFTTIDTESGDSGSGVFDAAGRLVAVTWGSGGAAVDLSEVRPFLHRVANETRLFPKLAEATKP